MSVDGRKGGKEARKASLLGSFLHVSEGGEGQVKIMIASTYHFSIVLCIFIFVYF